MSEMIHPPIALGFETDLSLEQTFAQEAYLLLADARRAESDTAFSHNIERRVTERVDVPGTDMTKNIALRLRNMPVFQIFRDDPARDQPSADYRIIILEYGEMCTGEVEDEAKSDTGQESGGFQWRPYVLTMIDEEELNKVAILDAQTGRNMSQFDLMTAFGYLMHLRQEIRSTRYEDLRMAEAVSVHYIDSESSRFSYEDPRHRAPVSEDSHYAQCRSNSNARPY